MRRLSPKWHRHQRALQRRALKLGRRIKRRRRSLHGNPHNRKTNRAKPFLPKRAGSLICPATLDFGSDPVDTVKFMMDVRAALTQGEYSRILIDHAALRNLSPSAALVLIAEMFYAQQFAPSVELLCKFPRRRPSAICLDKSVISNISQLFLGDIPAERAFSLSIAEARGLIVMLQEFSWITCERQESYRAHFCMRRWRKVCRTQPNGDTKTDKRDIACGGFWVIGMPRQEKLLIVSTIKERVFPQPSALAFRTGLRFSSEGVATYPSSRHRRTLFADGKTEQGPRVANAQAVHRCCRGRRIAHPFPGKPVHLSNRP